MYRSERLGDVNGEIVMLEIDREYGAIGTWL